MSVHACMSGPCLVCNPYLAAPNGIWYIPEPEPVEPPKPWAHPDTMIGRTR